MISTIKDRIQVIPRWILVVLFLFIGFLILVFEEALDGTDMYAILVVSYFFIAFLLTARWIFRQIKSILQLRTERSKTEVMHLQSQVNPHFFFNILNSLYGWVEKDPSQAQQLILKLSDMMRYSIYDGQKDLVTLEEEIDYLKNYIELHKIRYLKKINVNFDIDIRDDAPKVMPLLFIILVENAFKHGVENLRENAFVNIKISSKEKEVYFYVENNFDTEIETKQAGIGLKNLKRRLELVYPKKHTLDLVKENNIYKAALTIHPK